jgi:hypothetical protein
MAEVLSLSETRFSDRSIASQGFRIYSTADELERLPWRKIYHNTSLYGFSQYELRDIVSCRNAEIIVPGALALDSLKYIYCRSNAERETLLYLLPPEPLASFKDRIYSSTRVECFERKHTFLEEVRLTSDHVSFYFSPDTRSEGPFELSLEYRSLFGDILKVENRREFYVRNIKGSCAWRNSTPASEYEVRIYLDGLLIYANQHHNDIKLPF